MSSLRWPDKDKDELLDYTIDWSARLATDAIATSTWTVPSGLTTTMNSFDADSTTIWLKDGVDAVKYAILNHITTTGGRVMEQTVLLKVKEK
jgi:hypothetical protein